MTQYIPKSAVVAEIERRKEKCELFYNVALSNNAEFAKLAIEEQKKQYDSFKGFINSLEVKEVDLGKEIEKSLKRHSLLAVGKKDFTNIAKHFFELGLNASNSLTWKDVDLILDITDQIANDDSMEEKLNNMSQEKYCTEVLKRFKAQKGEKI